MELSHFGQIFLIILSSLIGLYILYHYMAIDQGAELGFDEGNFSSIPTGLWWVLVCVVFIFVALILLKKTDIGKVGKYFAYVISIIVTFFPLFIVNPFFEGNLSQGYSTAHQIHFNIAWETIYNVIDGVSFTYDTTPLYGHYALFFYLPLKLAGKGNYIIAISLIFAMLACIEQVAILYVIDAFSPKNWVAALLALASVSRMTYYMVHVFPIRTLFPVLLFALFTYLYKNKKKMTTRFGYVVSCLLLTMSFIFNLEMSVACAIGFAAYVVFELICEKASFHKYMVSGVKVFLICILSVALAIGTVNIYNLACGGPIILRAFFFPLVGGDTNIVNYIQYNFGWTVSVGNYAWEYILIFLLVAACAAWYLAINRSGKNIIHKEDSAIPVIGGMACTGIVAFAYYMNEPLWRGLVTYQHIIYGLFAIFLGKMYVLFEKDEYPHIRHQFVRTFGLMIIAVTVCGAVQLVNDPARIAARKWVGAYDVAILKEEVSQLDIPEDTYGIGQGINMIYHMLGMDNHPKFRDTTELDMPYSETFEKVIKELRQNDTVLINSNNHYDQITLNKLQERGFIFTPIKSFQIGSWEYTYCTLDYNGE